MKFTYADIDEYKNTIVPLLNLENEAKEVENTKIFEEDVGVSWSECQAVIETTTFQAKKGDRVILVRNDDKVTKWEGYGSVVYLHNGKMKVDFDDNVEEVDRIESRDFTVSKDSVDFIFDRVKLAIDKMDELNENLVAAILGNDFINEMQVIIIIFIINYITVIYIIMINMYVIIK